MVSIFGGSKCSKREEILAYEIGKLLGEAGFTVVTGAGPGVMKAVSRGNFEAGRSPIGIVPEGHIKHINKYVVYPITTNMGFTRNFLVGNSTPVGIAIGGYVGTLNEITNNLQFGKPVLAVNNWTELDYRGRETDLLFPLAVTYDNAGAMQVLEKFLWVYKNRKRLGEVGLSHSNEA